MHACHLFDWYLGVLTALSKQYFIRLTTASTIGRRVRLLHEPLKKAAKHAVDDLRKEGGLGGVIALDRAGNGKACNLFLNEWLIEYCIRASRSGHATELSGDVPWSD